MEPCRAKFDESIPLSGGTSARGAGVGLCFAGKTHPVCLRCRCRYVNHPSKGRGFSGSRARCDAAPPRMKLAKGAARSA